MVGAKPTGLVAEVIRLQALVEEQAVTIKELRGLMATGADVPEEWGLKRRERQIFNILLSRPEVSVEGLWNAVYGCERDPPDIGGLQSHISHLRAKIKSAGLSIKSNRNVGYSLIGREEYLARRRADAA